MLHFVLHNFFFKAYALRFRGVFIPLLGGPKSPQTPVNTGDIRKRPVNTGLSENIAFGAGEGTRTHIPRLRPPVFTGGFAFRVVFRVIRNRAFSLPLTASPGSTLPAFRLRPRPASSDPRPSLPPACPLPSRTDCSCPSRMCSAAARARPFLHCSDHPCCG